MARPLSMPRADCMGTNLGLMCSTALALFQTWVARTTSRTFSSFVQWVGRDGVSMVALAHTGREI